MLNYQHPQPYRMRIPVVSASPAADGGRAIRALLGAAVPQRRRAVGAGIRGLVAVAVLGAAAPLAAQRAFPADAAVQRLLDARVADGRAVGLVVGTRDARGRTRVYHAGASGRPGLALDGRTEFEIGSVTKTVTAALLAQMVGAGEARLDDPVTAYLPPAARVPTRGGRAITLRDLATHTAALPPYPDNLRPADPANPYADYTVAQLYAFLGAYRLPWAAGTRWAYSNTGFGLLGHALARRAGTDWEHAVVGRVLDPLGMADTRVALAPDQRARLAVGHDDSARVVPTWDIPALPGFGALHATADDLLRYVAANLEATRVPARGPLGAALAMTHVPRHPGGGPGSTIGLAWQVRRVPHGPTVVWHGGGTGGYAAFVAFDPAARRGVVVLSNTAAAVGDLGFHLLDPRLAPNNPALARALDAKAAQVGYARVATLLADTTRRDPAARLSEDDVNTWGYAVLQRPAPRDAIPVFALNVRLHPESANTYDSLAEAYEAAGDTARAVAGYRRSLARDPGNDHARERLAALGPPARHPR